MQGNRVYDNVSRGIDVSGTGVTVTQNVLYSNGVGVYVSHVFQSSARAMLRLSHVRHNDLEGARMYASGVHM